MILTKQEIAAILVDNVSEEFSEHLASTALHYMAKVDEWKYEAKCHQDIACGFMGEVKKWKEIADNLYAQMCDQDWRVVGLGREEWEEAMKAYEQAKEGLE